MRGCGRLFTKSHFPGIYLWWADRENTPACRASSGLNIKNVDFFFSYYLCSMNCYVTGRLAGEEFLWGGAFYLACH